MSIPKPSQRRRVKLEEKALEMAGLDPGGNVPVEERATDDLKDHPLNGEIYGSHIEDEFLASVQSKGVLTPLLITKEGVVISGHQRFHAAQQLKLEKVPVIVFPLTDEAEIQEALVHFNRQREKTNEQIAREYQLLKEVEEKRAGGRKRATLKRGQSPVKEIFPERGKGQARDIAASKLGISGKTAEKAATVVKEIDSLEEKGRQKEANQFREKLNEKSIDAAFKEVKQKAQPPKKKPGPPVSKLQRDISTWSQKVPPEKRDQFKERMKALFDEFGIEE